MIVPKSKQLPSGKWFVRLRLNGETYNGTFDTEKEADAWALSVKAQYKANQLKAKVPDEKKTIRTLVNEYLDSAQLAQNTIEVFNALLRRHFTQIMDKPYNSISNWQKAVNLELQKFNPNSVQLYWSKICVSLRFHALEVPTVKIPRKTPQRKEYLDATQIKTFCRAIEGNDYETLYLMMLSSMRVSEALSVTKDDITEKGIHVRGTKTESSDRFIPWMIPRLKQLCADFEPIAVDPRILSNELKRVCRENDLPELSCHSLRISFASLCYSKGVPDRICMKLAGWRSLQTMHSVYVRISDDDVDRYAKEVSTLFE